MIELIIILTDKQQEELERRADNSEHYSELEYLQLHLNEWLKNEG